MSALKYDIQRFSRLGGTMRVVAQADPNAIAVVVNKKGYYLKEEDQFITTPEDFIEFLEELLEATKAMFSRTT